MAENEGDYGAAEVNIAADVEAATEQFRQMHAALEETFDRPRRWAPWIVSILIALAAGPFIGGFFALRAENARILADAQVLADELLWDKEFREACQPALIEHVASGWDRGNVLCIHQVWDGRRWVERERRRGPSADAVLGWPLSRRAPTSAQADP